MTTSLRRCQGWKAEVYQDGRWRWVLNVTCTCGLSRIGDPMYGPPWALTRRRAERKAQRLLAELYAAPANRYPVPAPPDIRERGA